MVKRVGCRPWQLIFLLCKPVDKFTGVWPTACPVFVHISNPTGAISLNRSNCLTFSFGRIWSSHVSSPDGVVSPGTRTAHGKLRNGMQNSVNAH